MNVTELFIKRPVMTVLVVIAMVFFGIVGYFKLPVSYLPAVEFPTLQVTATLPGASPSTMAASVATPLEKQFTSMPGLRSMSSINSLGKTLVTLQFDLDRNIDGAASDTQAAISRASGDLPSDLPQQPYYEKVNPADDPILYMALWSDSLPIYKVNEYVTTFLTDTISMVNGVSKVVIYGESKLAVRVRVDPEKLAARGINIDTVRQAVAEQNVKEPVGTLDNKLQSVTIEATGQLKTAEEFLPMIFESKDGRTVRLSDVGTVVNSIKDDKSGSWVNGKRAVIIAIQKQPGSNTIQVCKTILGMLPTIRQQIPAGIDMDVLYDRSIPIKEAVDDVQVTLLLAVFFVICVIFFFLRNISATLIAAVAVPVSIVFTFAIMYVLGYSLDTLSLLALTLSVGFVVDDAVVMIENVVRHLEMGKKPYYAALEGAKQITFTIVSMTLSLSVVFIPLMYMSGIIGRILHEFAMTITVAILASGVVSLTLTPMLASRLLKPGSKLSGSDKFNDFLLRNYERSLHFVMRHRRMTMGAAGLILLATIHFFMIIPKGFLPTDDMSYCQGFAQSKQGISYNSMKEHIKGLEPILAADENIKHVIIVAGAPVLNQGYIFPMLVEPHDRKMTADEVARSLMQKLNQNPGIMVWIQNPPMIRLTAKTSKNLYQYTIQAPDQMELFEIAPKFEMALHQIPFLTGVNSDLLDNNPELWVKIDRDKASYYGVTAHDIENTLNSAYSERKVSTIYGDTDQYWVILEVIPSNKKDPRDLMKLYIANKDGQLVRLDNIATFEEKPGPMQVNHTGMLPSVTYSFNIAPGFSLSDATTAINSLALDTLPDTVVSNFEGTADEFQKSMSSVFFLLIIAIFIIFIILGILYESWIQPITIISGLPSAAIGGLLTLTLFGKDLDLFGIVGIIMLIGIVKKNAIMVVDFALEAEEAENLSPEEAAIKGSLERFRPIMMTTVAAIAGAMPIALGLGAGAEARQPMGLAIVGGLVLSQVVTLYLTPVFYTYMDTFQKWLYERGRAKRDLLGIPHKHDK
ncbi:efflux RND transporter permease subunit [Maridesulfovibrio ferrireducens]|uniref:efflux RND transporter permease subunit n=1 Tax=Maridesulfovibrio ferrireducens TaxID=246191 RepID=UPI001A22CB15|nr:efflux RND transporter permease subunit [Maridesulfovibrio ferrireducens]MBI9111562.1 efflux RND transporter permease subunit [Maridesulfovibrio ferrireducens]